MFSKAMHATLGRLPPEITEISALFLRQWSRRFSKRPHTPVFWLRPLPMPRSLLETMLSGYYSPITPDKYFSWWCSQKQRQWIQCSFTSKRSAHKSWPPVRLKFGTVRLHNRESQKSNEVSVLCVKVAWWPRDVTSCWLAFHKPSIAFKWRSPQYPGTGLHYDASP